MNIIAAGSDGDVFLWDKYSGKLLLSFPSGNVALAPDGRISASGAYGEIFLRNLPSGDVSGRLKGPQAYLNAIAYSPDGKGITVSVKPNEDGTKVLLSVLDRGCGIAQKEQSRIFERFYRGGNQNGHSEEGIGLGLAIVKHVALTHHGSASVWSAPGQGSTFTLELPVARN